MTEFFLISTIFCWNNENSKFFWLFFFCVFEQSIFSVLHTSLHTLDISCTSSLVPYFITKKVKKTTTTIFFFFFILFISYFHFHKFSFFLKNISHYSYRLSISLILLHHKLLLVWYESLFYNTKNWKKLSIVLDRFYCTKN